MITMSKSAAAAKKYFADHLLTSDYLSQNGARPGLWFGMGAERLGLKGEVKAKDFMGLADNKHPKTDERLTVRDVANARPGYDFTFSPPKSVSSLWAHTGDERLADAFRQSVIDTLREDIEPEMKTRLRRNGENRDVVTGNLVAALFQHDTTRPLAEDQKPDPHLHVHAYVFSRTWAPHEGRWQAAQLGDLHLDGRYLEAAFESRFGQRLRALGYELQANGKSWEIAGVPQTVIDKFSRRKFEVEAEAKKRGITDPKEKAELASLTRQKKNSDALATPALHEYWNGRLSDSEAGAMDAVVTQAQSDGNGNPPVIGAVQAIDHALAHFFGPDGRESAVAEKAVLEEALRYSAGGAMPCEIKDELAKRNLIRAEMGGRVICTTPEVLAEEQAMVNFARAGRNACIPLNAGTPYAPDKHLSPEQAAAVSMLLNSTALVNTLVGKSGTGKTTTLKALDAALRERGRQLVAFAPTARASRGVLRSKGFETADTLANLLTKPDSQSAIRGNVVLIDEAGLAGTRALRQVFDLVESQRKAGDDTRVLLVGDPRQHRGVPRGQILTILQEQAGLTPARLNTIRRQEDPGYRRAVEALSEGKAEEGFGRLDALGFIREISEAYARYALLAKDYADTLASGQTAMIVAPTHAEGRAVTAAVREELRARERLGAEDRHLIHYENKSLTIAQRKEAALYQAGEMVQFSKPAPGFKKGEKVSVVGRECGVVQVKNVAGDVKELPLALAERFELYRTDSLAVADHEQLRITRNGYALTPDGKKHWLNNGDVVRVRFTPKGDLVDDRGWIIPASYGHFAHGVVTSHASQGSEANVVYVAQSGLSRGASSAEQFYVSAGRGEKALRLYTDDKQALRAAVARSDQTRSASTVWEASRAEREAAQRAGWRHRLRRQQKRCTMLARCREMGARVAEKAKELVGALRRQSHSEDLGYAH